MDQDLKQRLVGAVVITALAAIFVPMLFDDPVDDSGKMISELKIPEAPAILNEDSTELPKNIDDVTKLSQSGTVIKQVLKKRVDSQMDRWFLQVGSFGQKENAAALQDKLRKQGFPASIMTVYGEKGALFKVRVGPELDKKRAEAMKVKLDKLNNIKSILSSES